MSDKPPLGKNPFEAEIAANTSVSTAGVAAPLAPNPRDLNSQWFQQQMATAESGIANIKQLPGWMEVRFSPETVTDKSARELLEAVQHSEIKTFGWPIGVTLQNRAEFRPRPTQEGIKAEIAIDEGQTGRSSYDYWALTRQGDFYLLQSLFEDMRKPSELFFNTRIVRVTEALLFAEKLYAQLGASPQTRLKVRFTHKGLKGRKLTTSSPNRIMSEYGPTEVESSSQEFVIELGQMRAQLPERVQAVCAPMFEMFDFAQFGQSIYEDIVYKFTEGVVS